MDRTSTRRPRRLRALLVAAALGASMFATALPAAAAPPDQLFNQEGNFSPQGFTWLRNADEFTPGGFTWLRDDQNFQPGGFTWLRGSDGEFGIAGFTWLK